MNAIHRLRQRRSCTDLACKITDVGAESDEAWVLVNISQCMVSVWASGLDSPEQSPLELRWESLLASG
jgi:hypothetical protein